MNQDQQYSVAIAGATGAVGREMLCILEERRFPVGALRLMASSRSQGQSVAFGGREIEVEDLATATFEGIDFALFSAGGAVSLEHAPRAVREGAVVIDNTSAFRMASEVPLVVPEVNGDLLEARPRLIANPNCSTIQMVVALKPLDRAVGINRVIVSTYQSVSGAGQAGIDDLHESALAFLTNAPEPAPKKFAHPIAFEALPHIDVFEDNGYTREEMKMIRETRKILERPDLEVSATCVRIPVFRAHSESITVELDAPLSAEDARRIWSASPGLKVYDDPTEHIYPLARLAQGTDPSWIGRVRQDLDRPHVLHFWLVSDNLRKGAALNAIQIAEIYPQLGV